MAHEFTLKEDDDKMTEGGNALRREECICNIWRAIKLYSPRLPPFCDGQTLKWSLSTPPPPMFMPLYKLLPLSVGETWDASNQYNTEKVFLFYFHNYSMLY